jgi:putative ABC transport system substrate-binding protein
MVHIRWRKFRLAIARLLVRHSTKLARSGRIHHLRVTRGGVGSLSLLIIAVQLLAPAQASGPPQLCFLAFDAGTFQSSRFKPFFERLRALGWTDGQTISVKYLSAEGQSDRFPALVADCLRLKPAIIVAQTTPAAKAAKNATTTVPIVMYALGDPVATGLVASLARPGANITGTTTMSTGTAAKRLSLLKEAVPGLSRVLVLSYLVDPIAAPQVKELQSAADTLGLTLLVHDIRNAEDFAPVFEAGSSEGAQGVLTTLESIFVAERERVVELAAHYKLPGLYHSKLVVEAGGLMAYDSFTSLQVLTATYVDKILNGANPSDLPVQQTTDFELIINLKAAKALGLTIPSGLLARADEVIE